MEQQTKKDKELVWLQVFYLYLAPTLLIFFNVIPGRFRILVLLFVLILLYGITVHEKWTHLDFGIQKSWKKYFWPYFFFTIGGVIFLFIIEEFEIGKPFLVWWKNLKFLLLFIPLSVMQEIVFRGILMHMLRRAFKSPIFIIILNAVLFALIHIIYINSAIVLPLMFVAGIGFAWIYYKYPNLILISIAHSILNFIAMIFGLFVLR